MPQGNLFIFKTDELYQSRVLSQISIWLLKGNAICNFFDHEQYKEDKNNRCVSQGYQMINVVEKKCRMKYGRSLNYNPSVEHNLTESMHHQLNDKVKFDGNQDVPILELYKELHAACIMGLIVISKYC